MKLPTLKTIPLDMILTVGKLLLPVDKSSLTDINQITLAAILQDKGMLEHLIERCDETYVISDGVALSGNLKVLKWIIKKKKCSVDTKHVMLQLGVDIYTF